MTDQLSLFRRQATPDSEGISETVPEAAERVRKHLDLGIECPVCHQRAQRYKRSITSAMAHVLGLIARWDRENPTTAWLHVPSFLTGQPKLGAEARGGDFAKLVHWGLLEQKPGERDDGSKRTGWYRLTTKGRAFARNELPIRKHIYIYNRVAEDVPDSENVYFAETLGKGFDYWKLMYGHKHNADVAPTAPTPINEEPL